MVSNKSASVTAKPKSRETYYPFITAAARTIGISRITLYRVLKGQHPDRGDYAKHYHAFVTKHSKEVV